MWAEILIFDAKRILYRSRDLPGKCPGEFFGMLDFLPIGNTQIFSQQRCGEVANFIQHLLNKEGTNQSET